MSGSGEFDFISERLAPLTAGFKGALGLKDDAALLSVRSGRELVITADTLVEGRHFLKGTNPALVARKALRVNLSDLAAMGARPIAYMTAIVWPAGADDALRHGFVDVPAGKAITRSGARPGDCLVVTGTIGDACLGLKIAREEYDAVDDDSAYLLERLQLPTPRLLVADALRAHAHALIDISDGLIADCGHLARASDLALRLDLDTLPLSGAAQRWLDAQDDSRTARLALASFGDDYELACAVPEARVDTFVAELRKSGLEGTIVGRFAPGSAVTVVAGGEEIEPGAGGFTHF